MCYLNIRQSRNGRGRGRLGTMITGVGGGGGGGGGGEGGGGRREEEKGEEGRRRWRWW